MLECWKWLEEAGCPGSRSHVNCLLRGLTGRWASLEYVRESIEFDVPFSVVAELAGTDSDYDRNRPIRRDFGLDFYWQPCLD